MLKKIRLEAAHLLNKCVFVDCFRSNLMEKKLQGTTFPASDPSRRENKRLCENA